MHKKTPSEEFLLGLEWTEEARALMSLTFGTTLFMFFGNATFAKIELTEKGLGPPTLGTYVGLEASIVNIRTGLIDRQLFLFEDLLDERKDEKRDYKGGFCVVAHCGWKWYIAVPKSTNRLTSAVMTYVNMFK